MAILRSVDGRFFEIPDDQVEKYLIPADKVKEKLESSGAPMVPPSDGGAGGDPGPLTEAPTIVVQVFGASAAPGAPPPGGALPVSGGEVQPYFWNNWWHNRRPGWNNWWHNWHR